MEPAARWSAKEWPGGGPQVLGETPCQSGCRQLPRSRRDLPWLGSPPCVLRYYCRLHVSTRHYRVVWQRRLHQVTSLTGLLEALKRVFVCSGACSALCLCWPCTPRLCAKSPNRLSVPVRCELVLVQRKRTALFVTGSANGSRSGTRQRESWTARMQRLYAVASRWCRHEHDKRHELVTGGKSATGFTCGTLARSA